MSMGGGDFGRAIDRAADLRVQMTDNRAHQSPYGSPSSGSGGCGCFGLVVAIVIMAVLGGWATINHVVTNRAVAEGETMDLTSQLNSFDPFHGEGHEEKASGARLDRHEGLVFGDDVKLAVEPGFTTSSNPCIGEDYVDPPSVIRPEELTQQAHYCARYKASGQPLMYAAFTVQQKMRGGPVHVEFWSWEAPSALSLLTDLTG